MGKYRLLSGKHVHGKVWYKPGDIIESKINLIERFGSKFGLVESSKEEPAATVESNPVAVADPPGQREELLQLSVKELREFAESEEIDVTTCSKKDEFVSVILTTLSERG